jgi:hypothetical protein
MEAAMKLRIASLAVMSCLVASAALAQAPARSCARVEVSSGSATTPRPGPTFIGGAPRFSVTKILDLTFTVLFPSRIDGEHLVELRVFTPDAQLYRSMAMPVVGGGRTLGRSPGRSLGTRSVDGYARPLPEQAFQRVARGRGFFAAASMAFPVAGTDIVSSGLYGRWRVEAYVDGAERRCAPAAWFTLRP